MWVVKALRNLGNCRPISSAATALLTLRLRLPLASTLSGQIRRGNKNHAHRRQRDSNTPKKIAGLPHACFHFATSPLGPAEREQDIHHWAGSVWNARAPNSDQHKK
jgi:hypothetical protein